MLYTMFAITSLEAQVVNDECSSAISIPGNTGDIFNCFNGTTKNAQPDLMQYSPCRNSGFPVVWYTISDLFSASHFSLQIKGEQDDIFMMQLFGSNSDCTELIPLPVTINEQYCVLSLNGSIDLVGKRIDWGTYYIAVVGLDSEGFDFTICVNREILDADCGRGKELTITRDVAIETPQQPFFTGEELNVSMKVSSYNSSHNSCQWFQGLVPVFGNAWDTESFDIAGEPHWSTLNQHPTYENFNGLYGNSTWSWFTDVDYHSDHYEYQVADFDGNGFMDICHSYFQKDCQPLGGLSPGCCNPCWNSTYGSILPGGWFAYGINGTCPLPGPPVSADWGDGGSCGINQGPWNFEFRLRIKSAFEFQCDPNFEVDKLSIGYFTFSDREVGSWAGGDVFCSYDVPIVETLPVVCIQGDTSNVIIKIEACPGDTVYIRPSDYYSPADNIRFWGIYTHSPSFDFSESYLPPEDSLMVVVSNTSQTQPKHIRFPFYGFSSPQSLSTILQFDIIVYPEPYAGFTYSLDDNTAFFRSNQRINSTYFWDFGDNTSSTNIDPAHSYSKNGVYEVQQIVTNYCGSDTAYQSVVIALTPIANFTISGDTICLGDTILLMSSIQDTLSTYQWQIEGGHPNSSDQPEVSVVYTDPGYFDIGLMVGNAFGADTLTIDSAIHVLPAIDIAYNVEIYDSLCVFNFTGHQDQYVEWWLEDSLLMAGPAAQHIFDSSGTYHITLKAYNDCGTDSIKFGVVITTVSAHEIPSENIISIYPNPATDWIKVFFDDNTSIKRILVYDSFGNQVLDDRPTSTADFYQLTGLGRLHRGLYILVIDLDGKF
ncbi:MAG: PKD domain-containing protein, partial [Saprospiraceae bacterium]|nr:PKD domain-containing protein [Saprospiraceae bacterium]